MQYVASNMMAKLNVTPSAMRFVKNEAATTTQPNPPSGATYTLSALLLTLVMLLAMDRVVEFSDNVLFRRFLRHGLRPSKLGDLLFVFLMGENETW